MAPYRAKKLMYYLDRRFSGRAGLSPPDSARDQRAQLPRRAGPVSDWAALAPISAPAPPPPPPPLIDTGEPVPVPPGKPAVGSGDPPPELDLTDGAFASVFEQVDEAEDLELSPERAP